MFKFFKKQKIEPPESTESTEIKKKPIFTFTLEDGDDFQLEIVIPGQSDYNVKLKQCISIANFIHRHIKPEIYPMIELLLDKMVRAEPDLLVDYKAITNILYQYKQQSMNPVVRPTEAFMIRGGQQNAGN